MFAMFSTGVVFSGISHFPTIFRDKSEDYGASL